MSDTDYGQDVSCTDDMSEEGLVVSGEQLITEALIRRWSTTRGGVLDDPDGGTDLTEYLNDDVDDLALSRIRSEVRAEALKEVGIVLDCTVTSCAFIDGRIVIAMIITLSNASSFPLTIAVSSVTVEVLTP